MTIQNQKTHILTPKRKKIVKCVTRKSNKSVANECMKSDDIRKYILLRLGIILRQEIKSMCSKHVNSILQQSISEVSFSWELLISELSTHAPLLFRLLTECTKTRSQRRNRNAVIGICSAILLKYRYMNMSMVQKIVSVILYTGHSSKMVCDFCT